MAGLNNILAAIRDTNTNITGQITIIDEHLDTLLKQGKRILDYIQTHPISPLQLDEILKHVTEFRAKIMQNLNGTPAKLQEVTRVFDEILRILSPNGNITPSPTSNTMPNTQTPTAKENVLELINTLDESPLRSNNTTNTQRIVNIKEAIKAVKTFLENDKNVVNKGLLEYLDQRYMFEGIVLQSFFGEMATKHKPVLKLLVDLAGLSLEEFAEKIKKPTTMFNKVDVSVRFDILTAVSVVAAEEKYKNQNKILNPPFKELHDQLGIQQTQEGGRRTMRKNRMGCGCGVKFAGGSRRSLKKVKAVKNKKKQKTVKQKQKR